MRYLLDTHLVLWARLSPDKLSPSQKELLADPRHQKLISTTTLWEISLKFASGKLDLGGHNPEAFLQTIQAIGIGVVTPMPADFISFHQLPAVPGHKDPFDRMLIWQAIQSKLHFVSSDRALPDYKPHGLLLA